ncbi:MAG: M20/M25/M40 family metallo-hydrolase [Bacteroidales bacterium]|nr:M20/M25/M40 family metallo-hydrolase [Bacteroidales bacterium]
MKKILLTLTTILCTLSNIVAQNVESLETLAQIKTEAFQNSKIEELSFWFTDYMGARLSGSEMYYRAENIAKAIFDSIGLVNINAVNEGKFNFQGWDFDKCYIAMTAPYYSNFTSLPAAWCGSSNGTISGSVIYLNPANDDELSQYKDKVKGSIVLLPSSNTYTDPHYADPTRLRRTDTDLNAMQLEPTINNARRINTGSTSSPSIGEIKATTNSQQLRKLREFAQANGAAAIVYEDGYYNVLSGQSPWFYNRLEKCCPEISISREEQGRMARLIEHGIDVKVELEVSAQFNGKYTMTNLFAEIPGESKKHKDEYVLIGAHLDSWIGGTGANDNASGCIVATEAMRILKAIGAKPKRTIRIALWSGEEQGILGSAAYAENQNMKEPENAAKMALYLNTDNGSGQFRGICFEGNYEAEKFLKAWGEPIKSLGFTTISPRNSYRTDHTSFVKYGAPAYQFIQDNMGYGLSYHTNMDRYERMAINDMKCNAAIIAWLALNAANDENKIPLNIK